jgi:hypothetical protein
MSLAKAKLFELDANNRPKSGATPHLEVQFNPETLKVSYQNQVQQPGQSSGGGAGGGAQASTQFVGRGSSKLNVQLWFDVTGELPSAETAQTDVRQLTRKVIYFLQPSAGPNNTPGAPPKLRFEWGSFRFDGALESVEESLEFFSADGVPLRANLTLSVSRQDVEVSFSDFTPAAAPNTPGTRPLTAASAGISLPGMADLQGGVDWQAIAAANGITNPRQLAAGTLVDLRLSSPL